MKPSQLHDYVNRRLQGQLGLDMLAFEAQLVSDITDNDKFPGDWWTCILECLEDERIIVNPDGWKLVNMLSGNWADLNEEQVKRTLVLLQTLFNKSPDWMTAFVIAETLAEQMEPRSAVAWIIREAAVRQGALLACLIHAVEQVWPRVQGMDERNSLRALVSDAANDADADVRREVAKALPRLV